MKKYKVTSAHKYLRVGLIVNASRQINCKEHYNLECDENYVISSVKMDEWLLKGWAKEAQIPKYTHDQVIDIIEYAASYFQPSTEIEAGTLLSNWANC